MNDNEQDLEISSPAIKKTGVLVVDKAIDLVKSYQPNFFVGVKAVVPDPPSEGGASPGTAKGFVTNKPGSLGEDRSKTIYIFVKPNRDEAEARLKQEVSDEAKRNQLKDEATSIVIAETIIHENEHVKDELKHGEAPAEQKQRELQPFFQQKWDAMLNKVTASISFDKLSRLAHWFEKATHLA